MLDEEIRNICDADDCIYNNKQGICYHGAVKLRRLHCIDYVMDKPYLDAQLKAERVKKALEFPVHISFEQIETRKELDTRLDGKLPHHTPPEKAGKKE